MDIGMKMASRILLILNTVSFFIMCIDKNVAKSKNRRISEKTLLLIAILGGSVGVLAGMRVFRHKTRHIKFVFGVPLIIVLQGIFVYFLRKSG